MNKYEKKIIKNLFRQRRTDAPYTIITQNQGARYKEHAFTTYALGFRKAGVDVRKYRNMLIKAGSTSLTDCFYTTDNSMSTSNPLKYSFDTLVLRAVQYDITPDTEEVQVRLLFLKDGKEVLSDLLNKLLENL